VFCDLSTPKNDGTFNVYDDMREKLIARGIPAEQVRFIHEATTDAQKKELFGKVRSGEVRVLFGSTPKMGAGTNRADFNSNRRFYRWTNDIAEYLEDMADRERQTEVGTVAELLDEIESENLYQVLVAVDGRTLKIVLLKMQGYSTKEIAPLVHLTTGAIYARLDHLRKKLRKFYSV